MTKARGIREPDIVVRPIRDIQEQARSTMAPEEARLPIRPSLENPALVLAFGWITHFWSAIIHGNITHDLATLHARIPGLADLYPGPRRGLDPVRWPGQVRIMSRNWGLPTVGQSHNSEAPPQKITNAMVREWVDRGCPTSTLVPGEVFRTIDWGYRNQDLPPWSSGPERAQTWVRILMIIVCTACLLPLALIFPRTWWRIVKS